MRKSKFSESQIVGILKEADAGVPVADPLRKHGVSKATFFKWRSKYAGAGAGGSEGAQVAPPGPANEHRGGRTVPVALVDWVDH